MRVTFDTIGVLGTKRGVCNQCGKKCQRSRRFYQTINPYNLNSIGAPKTRQQILSEETVNKDVWLKDPVVTCKKCYDAF